MFAIKFNFSTSGPALRALDARLRWMIRLTPFALAPLVLAPLILTSTTASATEVLVSIAPVHSLVSSVMKGSGEEPGLIVEGKYSPHHHSLKPSVARKIQNADIVFWVGPSLESFLTKPLTSLTAKATVIELSAVPGLTLHRLRADHLFSDEHDHAGETEPADDAHSKDELENTPSAAIDPHLWLDPDNAAVWVQSIEETLSQSNPEMEALYKANAVETISRLKALNTDIQKTLDAVQGREFVVLHDAYQYFEKSFGLQPIGSVMPPNESRPGAQHIRALADNIRSAGVRCIFSEPQESKRLVESIFGSMNLQIVEIDPLGAQLAPGPDLYFVLLESLASTINGCLSTG